MRRMVLVVAVGALLVALSAAVALATTRFGTDGADWLYGYAGNEAIYTGTGADRVYSGPGDDFISFVGGDSRDYVHCGLGFDTVEKRPVTGPANLRATNCEKFVY